MASGESSGRRLTFESQRCMGAAGTMPPGRWGLRWRWREASESELGAFGGGGTDGKPAEDMQGDQGREGPEKETAGGA